MKITATIFAYSRDSQDKIRAYLKTDHYFNLQARTGVSLLYSSIPLDRADHDAVIAPGNSFGIMTGGFDQGLVDAFGAGIQNNVMFSITELHNGELNVGAAELVRTGGINIPWCAYAPTMRVPKTLPADSDVPYMATRAGLLALVKSDIVWPREGIRVLIPLMGVGTGGLAVDHVLHQIQQAIATVTQDSSKMIDNLEHGLMLDEAIRLGIDGYPSVP